MEQELPIRFALTKLSRMIGLLKQDVCADGEVLLLLPCKSVHTFGMKVDIDVAFIDDRGRVLKVAQALPPRRFCSCVAASGVLERRSKVDNPWFETGGVIKLSL